MNNILRRMPALILTFVLVFALFSWAEEEKEADAARKAAIAKLASTDWIVSSQALLSLADDKGKEVDTALDKAFEANFPYPQMIACNVAANRKRADLIPIIAKLCLTSAYRTVVDAAAEALALIDATKSYTELQNQWNGRTDKFGVNFARALYYFKDADKDDMHKLLKSNKDNIASYVLDAARIHGLTDFDKDAYALKPKTGELQYCINEYLGIFKDTVGPHRYLINQLTERDPNTLMRAGYSLAQMNVADISAIIPHVSKRSNPAEAASALKALIDRTSYPELKEIIKLLSSKNDNDKIAACMVLEFYPDPKNAKALQGIIKGKNKMDVRFAALKALAAINKDDKTAVDTIKTLMSGSNDDKWLGLIGIAYSKSTDEYDKIYKVLMSGPEGKLASAIGYTLSKLDVAKGYEILKDALSKKQIKVAATVAIAIRWFPYTETIDILIPQLEVTDKKYQTTVNESLEMLTGNRFPPRAAVWTAWWDKAKDNVKMTLPKPIVLQPRVVKEAEKDKKEETFAPVRFWANALPNVISSRKNRFAIVGQLSKDMAGERLAESGLMWLANFQDLDGKWSASNFKAQADEPGDISGGSGEEWDQAVTALAVLAFIQAGYSPISGPYCRTIKRGLDFLRGNLCPVGHIIEKNPRIPGQMFEYAMVCSAFVEAVLAGAVEYRDYAQRTLYILSHHQAQRGGWGYTLDEFQAENTAITIWCAEAILKGEYAGLDVLPGVKDSIWNWFVNTVSDTVTDYQSIRDDKMTQAVYDKKFEQSVTTGWKDKSFFAGNTAMAVYALQLFGLNRDNPALIGRCNPLKDYKASEWNTDAPNAKDYPHHFHVFLSRAKALKGGEEFKEWYSELVTFLGKFMEEKGCAYGSWKPQGWDGTIAGRIYATAMSVMALQAPYSYRTLSYEDILFVPPAPEKPAAKPEEKPEE